MLEGFLWVWMAFGWIVLVYAWWPRTRDMGVTVLLVFMIGLGFWVGMGYLIGGVRGAYNVGWLIVGVVGLLAPLTLGFKPITDVYYALKRTPSGPGRVARFCQALTEAHQEFARIDPTLPLAEQLIAKIEEGMDVQGIVRLLDRASLDAHRRSDGVTLIMATVRYVNGGNYQNTYRRLKCLWEIARRLPPERLKAALDAQDRHGWTALMHAANQMDAQGIALLLHLGATPGIPVDALVCDLLWERMDIELERAPVPVFYTLLTTLERPWS